VIFSSSKPKAFGPCKEIGTSFPGPKKATAIKIIGTIAHRVINTSVDLLFIIYITMYPKKLTIFIIYNQYNIQLSLDAGCKNSKLEFATVLNTIISV